jgi:hypothetical protein
MPASTDSRITLSFDEVEKICKHAIALAPGTADFEKMPLELRLQVLAGTNNIVIAIQNLGYRITRPLQSIEGGKDT